MWGDVGFYPANCFTKNALIQPAIIPELELGNVQRDVLPTHFVEATNDTALQNAPEAFDSVGVDRPDDLAVSGVVHGPVRLDIIP